MRVLALVEAETVSGPAKNLLAFSRNCQELEGLQSVQMFLAPFDRRRRGSSAPAPPNEFLETALASGIGVHRIPEHFRFDPRVIKRLRELVELINPDLIQTHFSKSHFLLRISGLWKERPWIAFHHGHTRSLFRLRIYQGLDRWSLRAATQVVAVSRAFGQQLVSFGVKPEHIVVIHNAVEPMVGSDKPNANQLNDQKARLGLLPDDRVILAVGRLSKEKVFTDLVAAVAHVRQLHRQLPLKLIIVGEGSERQRIEDSIRSSAIQDITKLIGHVRNVNPYYEIADVVAISSSSEGSPNVLLEAMAAEVPIVATAVGGIPEIVTDREHALLVQPHDPLAMARAISLLLSDPITSQELARAARVLVVARYSLEQRAQALLQLYSNVYQTWQLSHSKHTNSTP